MNAEQAPSGGSWRPRPGLMPEGGYSASLGSRDLPSNERMPQIFHIEKQSELPPNQIYFSRNFTSEFDRGGDKC